MRLGHNSILCRNKFKLKFGGICISVKKHKTMGSGMFYGCALGIVFGSAFKDITSGMIFGIGIGSIIDFMKYSRKSKCNK